jgi:hypothetical protein
LRLEILKKTFGPGFCQLPGFGKLVGKLGNDRELELRAAKSFPQMPLKSYILI